MLFPRVITSTFRENKTTAKRSENQRLKIIFYYVYIKILVYVKNMLRDVRTIYTKMRTRADKYTHLLERSIILRGGIYSTQDAYIIIYMYVVLVNIA